MFGSNTLDGGHIQLACVALPHISWQRLVQANLLHLMFSVTP